MAWRVKEGSGLARHIQASMGSVWFRQAGDRHGKASEGESGQGGERLGLARSGEDKAILKSGKERIGLAMRAMVSRGLVWRAMQRSGQVGHGQSNIKICSGTAW